VTVHNRSSHRESVRRARMNAADADPRRLLPEPIPLCGGWMRVAHAKSIAHHLTTDQAADLIADLANGDNLTSRRALMDAGIAFEPNTTPPEPPATPAPVSPALPVGSPAPAEAALSVSAGAPASPSEPVAVPPAAAPAGADAITGAEAPADPSTETETSNAIQHILRGDVSSCARRGPPVGDAGAGGDAAPVPAFAAPSDEGREEGGRTVGRAGECVPSRGLDAVHGASALSPDLTTPPRCAPGRKRHRYNGPGACLHCGAPNPRGPKSTGPAAGSDQDRGLANRFETEGAPAPEITAAESTITPPPRTAVPSALLSKAQADVLPPCGGAGAPSVSGPGATSTAVAFADDMAAIQAAIEAAPVEAQPTSFADDAAAERVVAKILDREAQRKRIATQAEAMDRELANDIRGLAWRYGNALEEWARRNLRGDRRSHKTLSGTAGFAKVAARWSVEDMRAVEAWALAQDDPEKFGRYGYTLEPAAVLAYAKATGEAIPGLKLTAERETFYLKGDVRVDVTKARSAPALPEPTNPEEE